MAAVQRKLVHKQFNSPIGLYSQDNVKDTLNRELKAFGSTGIEIDDQMSRPLNLACSEVLRAVEEEEQMKCEPFVKCERQSRSRQRIHQRPHTPVHQHQLEQIKTQYLSHQHDMTIDRDTVLKINRLATRRNLHKREHSWPPTTIESGNAVTNTSIHEQFNKIKKNGKVLRQDQHIRSTSIDNALQFDKTVCKRHGIDAIREKFNSPTRIIEPTAQEVRQRREQQRELREQKQRQIEDGVGVDSCAAGHGVTTSKCKQMINLVKHEELVRKNRENKSATITDITIAQEANDKSGLEKNVSTPEQQSDVVISTEMKCDKKSEIKNNEEDELFKATTVPRAKGVSHPETKAADGDIGLVEPKRQFYEQLNSCKKWHSYENLNAVANIKSTVKPLQLQPHKRQAHSLERGRVARQHKQLPPQKPRSMPKLQRRSMKLATEIKISYDTDAQQHNIQVKSLNQPERLLSAAAANSAISQNDLEHIPLPATPDNFRKLPGSLQQGDKQQCQLNSDAKIKSLKDQQIYDDSCIFLRSIDLQDNTVAYIPAAITIVPSPTEELLQYWMESSNLKANIKGVNNIDTSKATATKASNDLQNKNENLMSQLKHESVKSVTMPEGINHKQSKKQLQQRNEKQNSVETKAETDTYVTRLSGTPDGIQLTRQTGVNTTKRKTQINNNNNDKKISFSPALTTKAVTHESPQKTRPPEVIESNATSAECNKIAEGGFYYTDGEYVYGPYNTHNGTPLANATIRSPLAEQQAKHQQPEIEKDIEAETKTQHKKEIASLTAKYENIQQSINEHLRQIDAYIENAKAALKCTIATDNKPESSASFQYSHTQPHYNHTQCNLSDQLQQPQQEQTETEAENETPLKVILRKITNIMQEVKPLYQTHTAKPVICLQPASEAAQKDDEENMPIVDKVLMDLNMLTKHLSEFDKNSSEELKPIMEQLDLQFETRPTATTASHVLINEEITNKESLMETGKNHQKSQTIKTIQPLPLTPPPPPPPPPPLPLPTTASVPMTLTKPKQDKRTQYVADKQLLATDKLITAQIQNQQRTQHSPHKQTIIGTTQSAAGHKDNDAAASEDKKKNLVFDFLTARHEQEQHVEQVIDTLGKLENESKENLVNMHVPAHDEKIKSNLNQQTLSTATTTSTNCKQKGVVVMPNCNVSILPNASGKDASNHDNVPKSSKGNESQLKLHIKHFTDKKPDKQFQKYDKPPAKDTSEVVNDNKNNSNKLDQTEKHDKHERLQCEGNNAEYDTKTKDEEGGSNHSSGSELSNTYKSSYELPSPYVTMPQISWEDVLSSAATVTSTNVPCTHQRQGKKEATTTSVLTEPVKRKHEIEIAQVCTKSPITLDKIETTSLALTVMKPVVTSGHVGMQSVTTSKACTQTRLEQGHHKQQKPDGGRKYPASLIEPHLPKRSTSPFGLNAIEVPSRQRSTSVSPTHLRTTRIGKDITAAADIIHGAMPKHPSPYLPTRATSPFGVNAEIKKFKRSYSTSPKRTNNILRTSPRTVDEMAIRKYPAPLAEPHVPTRAASPFGLNPVDVFNITRASTPPPPCGVEVKSDNEQEQECDYENVNKPTSPIRKYPPSLIEPHVPIRAASPFGLNAVDTTPKAHQRTPSPAHSPHPYRRYHPHEATLLKSTSTTSDNCRKPVAYIPQVEGHNIGLVVRTSTPMPYCHTDAIHASSLRSEEIMNATNTPHDSVTVASRDITDNNYCAANDIERDDDDNDATCDELQRINSIGLTKQGTIIATTTNKTMAHHLYQQHQPQKNGQHDEHHLQNQEQYSSGGSGQHMAVDIISQPASVINRSFDNVSPRPYISIEGYKRVAWPPTSEERIVREFTPQPQTQYQPAPAYNQQQQQHQPSAVPSAQPQQQQRTVSHDQVDQQQHHQPHLSQDQRGASPGIITLRKEAPISQKPSPVYPSQPAAISFRESSTDSLGGSSMRGDLKWPPPEYKEAAAKENEERRQLALGPVCRPRKVNRDYTSFFAKNALSHHYPSYKVPPGTQHMIN